MNSDQPETGHYKMIFMSFFVNVNDDTISFNCSYFTISNDLETDSNALKANKHIMWH